MKDADFTLPSLATHPAPLLVLAGGMEMLGVRGRLTQVMLQYMREDMLCCLQLPLTTASFLAWHPGADVAVGKVIWGALAIKPPLLCQNKYMNPILASPPE